MDVKELVGKWSPEEREKLKDLIEECLEREEAIKESGKRGDRAIKALGLDLRGWGADLFLVHLNMENLLGRIRGFRV
jgi:hypothetical protein